MSSTEITTGEALREWRLELGYTQVQAADALGFAHRSSISQLENGHQKITPKVAKLAAMIWDYEHAMPKGWPYHNKGGANDDKVL